jgi:hypothetical protein
VTYEVNLTNFEMDLAVFLATRGPYSWLGYDWMGCGCGWEYLSLLPTLPAHPDISAHILSVHKFFSRYLSHCLFTYCGFFARTLFAHLPSHTLFSYSLLALSSHMFSHTPLTHALSLFLHLHSLVLITRYNGMMPCDIYVRPDAMDYDYGEPTALCGETAPNSDVFVRDWTKSTVTVDCNTYTSKIAMKP